MRLRDNFIGDAPFYRRVLRIALPITIQNAITNFVALLDNVMIGSLGTEEMIGASVVNQLLLVFNLALFGAVSGIGIFSTQFFGRGDHSGLRYAFRTKLYACLAVVAIGVAILLFAGTPLIKLYLHDDGSGIDLDRALAVGRDYLQIMLFGMLPFAVMQAYGTMLREGGQAVLPMCSSIAAIAVNLSLNYILIFGKFGAPALGVVGAAVATVISRYVECLIIVLYTHITRGRWHFIRGAYRSFTVPRALLGQIALRATPLLFNEVLWSLSLTMISQSYSTRGGMAVAALNIATTVSTLLKAVYLGFGNGVAIVSGQHLGARRYAEAKRDAYRIMALSFVICMVVGGVIACTSHLFPRLYNTEPEIRELAAGLICVTALAMPISNFANTSYFVIRSGGRTIVTFLFDSVFMIAIAYPLATILSRFTALSLITVYAIVTAADLIKCAIGFFVIQKGIWMKSLDAEKKTGEKRTA